MSLGIPFLLLIVLVIPLIALIDILRSEFTGNNKIIWVLVVIFFNVLGSILYLFMGRSRKIATAN